MVFAGLRLKRICKVFRCGSLLGADYAHAFAAAAVIASYHAFYLLERVPDDTAKCFFDSTNNLRICLAFLSHPQGDGKLCHDSFSAPHNGDRWLFVCPEGISYKNYELALTTAETIDGLSVSTHSLSSSSTSAYGTILWAIRLKLSADAQPVSYLMLLHDFHTCRTALVCAIISFRPLRGSLSLAREYLSYLWPPRFHA